MIRFLRDVRWMSATGDEHPKHERENQSLCLLGHAGLSHLYVYVLDYIPHKTTAVPLFLALSFSHRICRASHESILPAVSWCPGHPPASPGVLSNFRIQSSICPVGSSVRRHLHPADAVTGVESNTLNFSWNSGMQDFIRFGTNEYGTHVEAINRNCVLRQILWRFGAIGSVGNAIGFVRPEVAEGTREHGYVAESFHPISSIPAGHNQAQGEAVHHGQRLVIHRIGDHYFAIACVVHRKCLHEVSNRW